MRSPRKFKSKSKSCSSSNSKQIVLVEDHSPVPLKVYDPRSPAALSLRTSPRFGPISDDVESLNATPKSSKIRALVDPNGLRKSPRFAPSPESVKSSNATSRATKVRALVDPNSLRRSPRLGPSPGEAKSSDERAPVDLNSLRKSPRFAPSTESVKSSNATSRATKVHALVDPNSLRRSPRLGPSPGEAKSSDERAPVDPNSLRKSPRFAPSCEDPKPSDSTRKASEIPALVDPNSLRRSPRLGPSHEELKPRELTKGATKTLALVDPGSLRRSPRLGPSSEELRPNDSTPLQSKTEVSVDPGSLRRSTRLGPSPFQSNVGKKQASVAETHGPRRSPRISGDRDGGAEPIARASDDSSKSEKVRKNSASRESKTIEEKASRKYPRFSPADHGGEKGSAVAKSRRSNVQNLTSIVNQEANTNADCLNKKCITTSPVMKSTQTATESSCLKDATEKVSPRKAQSPKRSFTEMESSSKPSSSRATRAREENGARKPMLVKNEPVLSGETHIDSAARLLSTNVDNITEVIKKVITEISNEIDTRPSTFSSALATEENIRGNPFDELSDSLDGCPSNSISTSKDLDQISIGEQEESNLIDLNFPVPCEEHSPKKVESSKFSKSTKIKNSNSSFFVGDPIPNDEAQERWLWRYEMKDLHSQRSKRQMMKQNDDEEDELILDVECHFAQANIRNCIFSLGDCAYIQGDGDKKHVGRIVEFFKTTNGEKYFRVQWFYFVEDTVIQQEGAFHDKRRLLYSTIMNDNLIGCIISKVHITKITPRVGLKISSIVPSDFYYDMEYCVDYSTFRSLGNDNLTKNSCLESTSGFNALATTSTGTQHTELALLDLYSGCGGMSTGLTLGAKVSGVNLVTRWAVDYAKSACESLKLNHPETHVRNEAAEDFLELLKEWEKLCKRYRSSNIESTRSARSNASEEVKSDDEDSSEEFEVLRLVDICYGDPSDTGSRGLKFKVHWKGYGSSEDSWEPVEGLSNCQEKIEEFVRNGMRMKILPLPAEVDVICGGPPCQGISGYNRFRNVESPLDDERNRQIVIFMDIVNFLKPKYVLMENVVDILRFDKGSLGRYALSRLVHLKYQARLGIIAAGCYGLPQFRLRVFLWGALPHENLPQFPLPTHDVIVRYWPPPEFERNTVAYDENQPRDLENALVLQDAISDLPSVTNDETREEMSYENPPETEFQKYIRSTKSEMAGYTVNGAEEAEISLYDHRPYPLFEDDYVRVCKIPKRKGANFRDLPGVVVHDNVARRDPNEEMIKLPSGKPLVPDYCFTFEQGKSKRPFARLWWDETVPTVLTYPSCHNQVALHPEQDRVLTVREYARLQGFPDYYRFCGTVKKRYCQVGNAVPVNVSRALGCALGMAIRKLSSTEPLLTLPRKFSLSNCSESATVDASQD